MRHHLKTADAVHQRTRRIKSRYIKHFCADSEDDPGNRPQREVQMFVRYVVTKSVSHGTFLV